MFALFFMILVTYSLVRTHVSEEFFGLIRYLGFNHSRPNRLISMQGSLTGKYHFNLYPRRYENEHRGQKEEGGGVVHPEIHLTKMD